MLFNFFQFFHLFNKWPQNSASYTFWDSLTLMLCWTWRLPNSNASVWKWFTVGVGMRAKQVLSVRKPCDSQRWVVILEWHQICASSPQDGRGMCGMKGQKHRAEAEEGGGWGLCVTYKGQKKVRETVRVFFFFSETNSERDRDHSHNR